MLSDGCSGRRRVFIAVAVIDVVVVVVEPLFPAVYVAPIAIFSGGDEGDLTDRR